MIDPTKDDIGRKVIYSPRDGNDEEGIITSFNDAYVFVRYGNTTTSAATSRADLYWLQAPRN